MSKQAIITAYVVAFIVSVVFAYGKGHRHGELAHLTLNKAIEIAKAQFKCEMVLK